MNRFAITWRALLLCLLTGGAWAQLGQVPDWPTRFVPNTGPACAAVTPDSWSPSFFTPGALTLSNSNLTATTTPAAYGTVVAEIGLRCNSAGKYYFEETITGTGGYDQNWGVATALQGKIESIGSITPGQGSQSVGYSADVSHFVYGGTPFGGGMARPASGDVVGIAVDLTNGLMWIRDVTVSSTTWYGNGSGTPNPVTGTNGFSFTPFAAPVYIAWSSNGDGSADSATMAAHTFAAAAPSGFSAWQP